MLNPEDRVVVKDEKKGGEKKGQEKATSLLDAKEAKQYVAPSCTEMLL
jgi:hypothetical protein